MSDARSDTFANEVRSGAQRIADERARQVVVEGWSLRHDQEHDGGELIDAARCYITSAEATYYDPRNVTFDGFRPGEGPPRSWPVGWETTSWKPTGDPLRDLTKAGALIAAEIDRLLYREMPDDG